MFSKISTVGWVSVATLVIVLLLAAKVLKKDETVPANTATV
jgi:hypothetical protein